MWHFFQKKAKTPEEVLFDNFFKNVLGFKPKNLELYHLAFLHKSMSKSLNNGMKINNERLEYLGDTVLSTVVADFLFKKFPYQGEGFLTVMRAKIVSRDSLNKLAKKIGLNELISYNRGKKNSMFKSINGNTFEALVGAMYIERGYDFTAKVLINRLIVPNIDIDELTKVDFNYKSKIIDWGQHNRKKVSFELVKVFNECGYRRQYEARVVIDGEPCESAIDFSIKAAEQLAAEKTYKKIVETPDASLY